MSEVFRWGYWTFDIDKAREMISNVNFVLKRLKLTLLNTRKAVF